MNIERKGKCSGILKPSCVPITIILILIFLVVFLPLMDKKTLRKDKLPNSQMCSNSCVASLVESIPEGLVYPDGSPKHISTFDAWSELIESSQSTLDIGSFYWTMLGSDVVQDPSDWQGEAIFKKLMGAGTQRGIRIRIAQNQPSTPSNDTEQLEKRGAAKVRNLNFTQLVGAGVLHTKLWISDKEHFYIGSANMDWRALTQVKEMGILVKNCSCLVNDLQKIFDVYWLLGAPGAKIPSTWPLDLHTSINKNSPLHMNLNNSPAQVYIGSSPPSFCPPGRTTDIDTILDIINNAEKFVYIAVMDYFPIMLYSKKNKFWPDIDNALRKVAIEKGVRVKLLTSHWNHSRSSLKHFVNSLSALDSSSIHIETKFFIVPTYNASEAEIPFSRVNHNKYMVTDKTAYIGTSNWSPDYFINTGGIGLSITGENHTIRQDLEDVFDRDWSSQYSHPTLNDRLL